MKLLDLRAAAGSLAARLRPHVRRLAMPLLAGLAVAAATYMLYRGLVDYEGDLIYRDMEAAAAQLKSDMAQQIAVRVQVLQEFARRWQRVEHPVREVWIDEAERFLDRRLQYRALEWLEPSLQARWRAPAMADLPGLPLDPQGDELRWREIGLLSDREEAAISRSVLLSGDNRQLLVCAPMFAGDRRIGQLVGVIRLRDLIDTLVAGDVALGYSVTVYEGSFLVFGPAWEESFPESQWASDAELQVDDLSLRVQLWPSRGLERRLRSPGPVAVLTVGLLLAIALGALIYRLQTWRERALAAEAALLEPELPGEAAGESEPLAAGPGEAGPATGQEPGREMAAAPPETRPRDP